jgi:hypothetical protein
MVVGCQLLRLHLVIHRVHVVEWLVPATLGVGAQDNCCAISPILAGSKSYDLWIIPYIEGLRLRREDSQDWLCICCLCTHR